MKKIKLLMFGLLSVLTLGLFVVTGRVNAANNTILSGTSYASTAKNSNPSMDDNFTMKLTGGSGSIKTKTYGSSDLTLFVTKTFTIKASIAATVTFEINPSDSGGGKSSGKTLTLSSDVNSDLTREFSSEDSIQSYSYDFSKDETVTATASAYVAINSITYTEIAGSDTPIAKTFKLNYNANGGSFVTNPSQSYTENDSEIGTLEFYNFNLTSVEPTRANYEFLGWATTATGDVEYVYDSTKETIIKVTGTTTLYAKWNCTFVNGTGLVADMGDLYDLGVTSLNDTFAIDGTIFTLYGDSSMAFDGGTTIGGVTYAKRVKLGGGSTYSNTTKTRLIGFTTSVPGILKVAAISGKDGESRNVNLYGGSSTVSESVGAAAVVSFSISSGTYYVGSDKNIGIYNIEFIPNTITKAEGAEEITVTPLVQPAVVGDYTYVRFITIVSGVNEFDATDVNFQITMKYADTQKADKTNTYTPHVVKRITSGGNTYSEGGYTFDNETNQYYVVYVARFTTATFKGSEVCGTVSFNGNSYTSDLQEI